MELLENYSAPQHRPKPKNLKKEIWKYARHWPWFLLSMALFYTAARIYLRYTEPQYLSKTALKLQESKAKSNTALSDLKNLGVGVSGDAELQGETTVIVSKPILSQVAKNLNLSTSFYSLGKIKEIELYQQSPLMGNIVSVKDADRFRSAAYVIAPAGKNSYRFTEGAPSMKGTYRLGTDVALPFGVVNISGKPGTVFTQPLKVVFRSIDNVVGGLERSISVALPPNKGLLMELSLVSPTPSKAEDILDEVSRQYNLDGVKDKNEEAQNTQDFINERLAIITDDLSGIESEKENFKRANQITDLESQAGIALQTSQENTKAALEYGVQLDLINSVYSATSGDQLLPSNMGLSSGLEGTISKYNDLVLTRNRVLKQATGANPAVIEMNKEISSLKNLIRKNLLESRETLQLQLAQANAQLNVAKGNIARYPTQEKVFRSIERQQDLKEQLYLYLLQKREENAITLAVKVPKAKVVNPAFTVGKVQPQDGQIIMGSLAAGFLLPLLILFGRNMLDTKVHTKDHISSHIPDASIIAEIPESEAEDGMVHPNDFSVFAESFRILSSNLKFMLKARKDVNKGVVLVTSSIKGEGKTTIAINTALTLAGKDRVLLLGADIRNPQLHRFVNGSNTGLTDYLVSDGLNYREYVVPSGLSENLDVLFSGAIAPNPNDLLDMKKFDEMISAMRQDYDYIVVDSAPVMLVSDTLHLIENSDVVLYVVKSDYTEMEMLDFAADFKENNDGGNIAYVLNNVKPENTRYGNKYGYGYYHTSAAKSRWKFWQK